jgi:hypothetical protein
MTCASAVNTPAAARASPRASASVKTRDRAAIVAASELLEVAVTAWLAAARTKAMEVQMKPLVFMGA